MRQEFWLFARISVSIQRQVGPIPFCIGAGLNPITQNGQMATPDKGMNEGKMEMSNQDEIYMLLRAEPVGRADHWLFLTSPRTG